MFYFFFFSTFVPLSCRVTRRTLICFQALFPTWVMTGYVGYTIYLGRCCSIEGPPFVSPRALDPTVKTRPKPFWTTNRRVRKRRPITDRMIYEVRPTAATASSNPLSIIRGQYGAPDTVVQRSPYTRSRIFTRIACAYGPSGRCGGRTNNSKMSFSIIIISIVNARGRDCPAEQYRFINIRFGLLRPTV